MFNGIDFELLIILSELQVFTKTNYKGFKMTEAGLIRFGGSGRLIKLSPILIVNESRDVEQSQTSKSSQCICVFCKNVLKTSSISFEIGFIVTPVVEYYATEFSIFWLIKVAIIKNQHDEIGCYLPLFILKILGCISSVPDAQSQ